MPVIDAHVHVFTTESDEFPREVSSNTPADRDESAEKLLGLMENNGVDQAVLVQIGGQTIEQHSYLLHCLRTYPDRFLGIGLVPQDHPNPEEHMTELAEGTGIIGFRLFDLGGPRDIFETKDVTEFRTYPIWKCAAEKDYVMWVYPRSIDAHLLPFLVEEFPQVRVVLNHLGMTPGKGKFTQDELGRPQIQIGGYNLNMHTTFRLARYENVTVHLSGQYAFSKEPYPYTNLAGMHNNLFNDFGSKRVMWATDYPWILEEPGYGELTTIIEKLMPNIRESELEDIMGGNAKRFLRFPDLNS